MNYKHPFSICVLGTSDHETVIAFPREFWNTETMCYSQNNKACNCKPKGGGGKSIKGC